MSRRILGRRGSEFTPGALCSCYVAPRQDPAIAEATRANTEIAREQLDLAREQAQRGTALVERFAPYYEQIVQDQLGDAATARERSRVAWDSYQQNFLPIERQVAQDAATYDSEGEIARRTGLAAGTVQTQFDAAQDQNARRMASMGISPTSGRSTQTGIDQANALALAKAGAINTERNNTKMTGIALRRDAAQIGRGGAATSLTAAGQGVGAGQAATSTMGAQTSQAAGALAPAQSFYSGAMGGHSSAANIGLGSFNSQMQSNKYEADSVGSTIGSIIGAIGMFAAASSKKVKKNVQPVDDAGAMAAMRKIPVKEWDYKAGAGDGGHHVGPMAEDVRAAAGDRVAPAGKQIDIVSTLGMHHAAIRDLDRRISARDSDRVPMQRVAMRKAASSADDAVML
ncbi:MAG: tail fiber domain-containing protein [Dehalococcoidia bacterium]